MKINIIFLFTTLFFIALLKNAHGGLVSVIFGKIDSTVHKIHEDVHKILLPKENINQKEVTSDNKQKINVDAAHTVNSNNENSETKIIVATTETTEEVKNKINSVIASPIKPDDAHHETEIKKDTAEETFVFATSSSTVAPVSSTTVKEGRENFAAGCTTGYKRTADGRCKPTF